MTKEQYDGLSDKERLMYNELSAFTARLAEKMDEMLELLHAVMAEAER